MFTGQLLSLITNLQSKFLSETGEYYYFVLFEQLGDKASINLGQKRDAEHEQSMEKQGYQHDDQMQIGLCHRVPHSHVWLRKLDFKKSRQEDNRLIRAVVLTKTVPNPLGPVA